MQAAWISWFIFLVPPPLDRERESREGFERRRQPSPSLPRRAVQPALPVSGSNRCRQVLHHTISPDLGGAIERLLANLGREPARGRDLTTTAPAATILAAPSLMLLTNSTAVS